MSTLLESGTFAAWAPSLVAVLAIIVGPFLSGRQIKASAQADEAMNRIRLVAEDLAAFLSDFSHLLTSRKLEPHDLAEWEERIRNISLYKARIALRLNVNKKQDNALNAALSDMIEHFLDEEKEQEQLEQEVADYMPNLLDLFSAWKAATWKNRAKGF